MSHLWRNGFLLALTDPQILQTENSDPGENKNRHALTQPAAQRAGRMPQDAGRVQARWGVGRVSDTQAYYVCLGDVWGEVSSGGGTDAPKVIL